MNVVVLMGGLSKEREISLRTGRAISAALQRKGHQVTDLDAQGATTIAEIQKIKPDAVFIALHGRFGEDGTIQGVLEWLKIPYTGSSVFSSSLCFEKLATKEYVVPKGILSPDYRVYRSSENLNEWVSKFDLEYPVIVKPNTEGSTIGISRVFKKEELKPAMEEGLKFDTVILAERYIKGREITVGVLNGRALPIVEIAPKSGFYDYESKYTAGKTEYLVPAPIDEAVTRQIQKTSEEVYALTQCEGAVRVDYILADDKAYFLEVNTIPGMTETSLLPKAAKAVGISFEDLCEEILKGARLKAVPK